MKDTRRTQPICWVFLPGLDGTGELFRNVLSYVPSPQRAIVVSYPSRRILNPQELVQIIQHALPTEDPYIIVAESFSGPLAIELAAARPTGLKGLVLCASFLSCPFSSFYRIVLWLVKFGLIPVRPPRWAVRRFLLGDDASNDLVEAFYNAIDSVDSNTLLHRIDLVFRTDVRKLLDQISVPILSLIPSQDRFLKRKSYREMVATGQRLSLVELDGPHLLLQRCPKEAAQKICQFLSQTVAPKGLRD